MAHNKEDVKYVGDSRIPARRVVNKPRPYSEYPGKTEAFFPNFLLKEWMVAVVVLFGFLTLVILHPAPLEKLADPNDTSYVPLPDWYFLFLYQLLKYFPGNLEVIGTVVIPGVAGLLLLLAPWLDRKPERRPSKRPIATGLMLFVIAGIIFLTWESVDSHNKTLAEENSGTEIEQPADGATDAGEPGDTEEATEPGDVVAGDFDPAEAYASCAGCHGANLEGAFGPTLVGLTLSPEEIVTIIDKGRGQMPAGTFAGSDAEKAALAEWILEHQ